MLEGISDSIKVALYDRLSNPLLSSFLLSWIILNYEVFVYLFSDLSPISKIHGINAVFADSSSWLTLGAEVPGWFIYGFWHPLILALFYLFVFPFPSQKVFKFWRESQKKLHEIKASIDDDTPITKEQSRKIKSENIDLRIKLEASSDSISELRERIQELLVENESLKNNSVDNNPEKNDKEIENDKKNLSVSETAEFIESVINDKDSKEINELLENSEIVNVDTRSFSSAIMKRYSGSEEYRLIIIILDYAFNFNNVDTSSLSALTNVDRIRVDYLLRKLKSLGLLDSSVSEGEFYITEKGKNILYKNTYEKSSLKN